MNVAEHAYLDQVSIDKDDQGNRIMTFDIIKEGNIRRPQYQGKILPDSRYLYKIFSKLMVPVTPQTNEKFILHWQKFF